MACQTFPVLYTTRLHAALTDVKTNVCDWKHYTVRCHVWDLFQICCFPMRHIWFSIKQYFLKGSSTTWLLLYPIMSHSTHLSFLWTVSPLPPLLLLRDLYNVTFSFLLSSTAFHYLHSPSFSTVTPPSFDILVPISSTFSSFLIAFHFTSFVVRILSSFFFSSPPHTATAAHFISLLCFPFFISGCQVLVGRHLPFLFSRKWTNFLFFMWVPEIIREMILPLMCSSDLAAGSVPVHLQYKCIHKGLGAIGAKWPCCGSVPLESLIRLWM